jgi:hypothetical protein
MPCGMFASGARHPTLAPRMTPRCAGITSCLCRQQECTSKHRMHGDGAERGCCCARRANNAGVKLAGLQSALAVMCAPTPAIAAPPSAASPEVKALASKEEAAMVALSR